MPDHDFTSTCDLYDEYLDKARVPTLALRNFGGRRRFSGRATTVTCFEDNSRVKELAQTPGTGRVMVVDGGGSLRCALVGDVIAGMAVDNGWEGIVVHAAIRDSDALAKLDIGVMALGSTPRKSVRNDAGEINVDVELGEVFCRPDDRVFADADGILLLDP
jgi:regulator of ribonuclease activity A